jgi:hypothetical protein
MMKWFKIAVTVLLGAALAPAEIRQNPGSKQPLSHDKYLHVISETVSPVQ